MSRGLGGGAVALFREAASQPKLQDAGAQRFRYSLWKWTQVLNLCFLEAFNLFFFSHEVPFDRKASGPFEKLEALLATTSVPVCSSTGHQREDENFFFVLKKKSQVL